MSSAVFLCLASTAIIFPVREKMEQPSRMSGLMTCSLTTLSTVMWLFGLAGYIAYGDKVKAMGSITLALPQNTGYREL